MDDRLDCELLLFNIKARKVSRDHVIAINNEIIPKLLRNLFPQFTLEERIDCGSFTLTYECKRYYVLAFFEMGFDGDSVAFQVREYSENGSYIGIVHNYITENLLDGIKELISVRDKYCEVSNE